MKESIQAPGKQYPKMAGNLMNRGTQNSVGAGTGDQNPLKTWGGGAVPLILD